MAVGRVDQYQRTGVAWEVWAWGKTQDNFRESRCHAMFDPTICFFRFSLSKMLKQPSFEGSCKWQVQLTKREK